MRRALFQTLLACRLWVGFLLVPLWSMADEAGIGAASPGAASSARAIRGLPDHLRKERPEVTLRGVVTFHHAASGLTYVEDEEGGIEVRGLLGVRGLEPGRRVELTGRVDDSRPLPAVRSAGDSVRVLEKIPLGGGLPLGAEQVRSGELDGRRVTMEGAVFRVQLTHERGEPPWLRLDAATRSGHLTWLVAWDGTRPLPTELTHSHVRVTGVCEALFNVRGQRIGMLLLLGGLDDIEVLRKPMADPFDRPTRSLAELMRPGLDDPVGRVRVEGVVLSQLKGAANVLHLRTAQGAIQVEVVDGDFEVGDRVAVVGYPVLSNKHAALREGVAKRLGREDPPEPLEMTVPQLLQAGCDSDLVRIRGIVLRNGLDAAQGSLFIDSGERVVEVVCSSAFDVTTRARMARELPAGTELLLTGVAELRGPTLITGTVNLTDMRMMVRTPADIVVQRARPWWTTGRLLSLAGGLTAVLALSVAWVLSLRRRVAAQTAIIRDKVEKETRWEERSRIARDIHDDVGSALTQITLLGDLGRRGVREPRQVEEQFDRISSEAREAVRALDAIVWTVNPKNDSLSVTVSYLCQTVQDLTRDAGIRCRLEIPEEIPPLALGAKVRHNLLLAAKEAVHNVLKHSRAEVLRLRMECGADTLRLEVCDDGTGFDPRGVTSLRTGLDSMRQRMSDIGGHLEISSETGRGTTIAFVLDWDSIR